MGKVIGVRTKEQQRSDGWVNSFVCVDPKYLNWSTSSSVFPFIYIYVGRWSWLDTVDENVAFAGAYFHPVTSSSHLQSFSELLELFFTASQQIDDVSKPQVAKWSSSDGH